jgi:hypothetical protein
MSTMPPAARGALFEKTAPLDPPQKLFIEGSVVSRISEIKRLKASKPCLHTNPNASYDFQRFTAFSADSVHQKKPSRWPKALIGPPCHGAPSRRRQK